MTKMFIILGVRTQLLKTDIPAQVVSPHKYLQFQGYKAKVIETVMTF